ALDVVGRPAIQAHHDTAFPAPGQAAGDERIDRVQAGEVALRSCVRDRRGHATDFTLDRREQAAPANARAEERQEDLLCRRAEVNRARNEAPLLRGEDRHWLRLLRNPLAPPPPHPPPPAPPPPPPRQQPRARSPPLPPRAPPP